MIYHFISGLPRSGSTLLASILRQNPAFYAGIISPMGPTVTKVREAMSPQQETHLLWTDTQQTAVVRLIFDAYYDRPWGEYSKSVIFDTNRRWCCDADLLAHVFPECRIICCVRHPVDIIASFEKLFRKNPITMGTVCNSNQNLTVFERVPILMASDGVVGYAYKAFRDAWAGPQRDRLYLIEYDELVSDPEGTLIRLHDALDLPSIEYRFRDLEQIPGAEEFDRSLGMSGLHSVHPFVQRDLAGKFPLPQDILATLPSPFWR